jgi:UDP-N-acetylmuramoyl-L-alanyl-D-glutamate--2,6-diaminopimelate ligase
MKFTEIAEKAFKGTNTLYVKNDFEVNKLCYNSSLAEEGDVFFAIKGLKFDGNDFIYDAISKGAKAVVSDQISTLKNYPVYKVDDCRAALALMSKVYFDNPSSKVKLIGVTGTNGKTTITNIINYVLQKNGKETGLIGTNGNFIKGKFLETEHTTPESLELNQLLNLMAGEGVEYVVMEVSSHALALKRVYGLDFDAAIFTNLTPEHLDFHLDMEEYFNTKKMLFDSMRWINSKNNRTYAIFNSDDVVGDRIAVDSESERISYGFENAAYTVQKLKMGFEGMNFDMMVPSDGAGNRAVSINTKLTGRFNVYNILASAASLKCFGIGYESFRDSIIDFEPVEGRFNRVPLKNGAIAIIDYAHTPDSLLKVLSAIREILDDSGSKAKIITVFGCGGDRDRSKRPEMGKIAGVNSDYVILTNDNPRFEEPLDIIEHIRRGFVTDNYEIEPDREAAVDRGVSISKKGDIILIAGKGHEDYLEIRGVRHYMSDMEITRRYV